MKIICSKQNLLNCINNVQKAVSTKSSILVLEGILIKAYNDQVTMTGNDLEIGIEATFNADVEKEGTIVLNSKFFGDIVRKLPEADITIETVDDIVHITSEHAFFKINLISPEGFPELQTVEGTDSFDISAHQLKELIGKSIIAVSFDENRPVLTGVLFEISEEKLILVAIDGFRMALRETEIKADIEKRSIVIPGKTLSELSKILDLDDDIVNINFSNNYILFSTKTKKLVSRLLEGEFPNYRSIIPKDEETSITVKRIELLEGLERAIIVSSDEKKYPVVLDIENDLIVITLNSDRASLREEIDINMNGQSVRIGFNAKFLMDALRVVEDDEVNMSFRGSVGPCLIKPLEKSDYLYLVVPVKIRNL